MRRSIMAGPIRNLPVSKYVYGISIALLAIQSAYVDAGGGEIRQMRYTASSPDRYSDQTVNTTVSARTAIECGSVCLNMDCSYFQFNATTKNCHLYSNQPELEPLKDGGIVYAADNQHRHVTNITDDGPLLYKDGWLVFVCRQDGSVDFQRPWTDYRDGFGDPNGEFWLGLETLHSLTAHLPYRLRVEMTHYNGGYYYAEYSSFQVGDESTKYILSVSGYDSAGSNDFGGSLANHDGMMFSTFDADNDDHPTRNCAEAETGGWWYYACMDAHPTGTYFPVLTIDRKGVTWKAAPHLPDTSYKIMRLMIKP